MTKGIYNFTDGNNKHIKDEAPEWMNDLFEKGINKSKPVIINQLFESQKPKIKKCSVCGKLLSVTEIGICGNCIKLK